MLTRDYILSGMLHEHLQEHADEFSIIPKDQLEQERQAFIAQRPCSGDLWVFGYGSLIWNPCAEIAERRTGRVYGYHRQFCLWTHLGRGSKECPGLMLGLERGGSVAGVALRIEQDNLDQELEIIWDREMITAAYKPAWMRCHTDEGPVTTLGFVINHDHDRYTGMIDDGQIVEALAVATGPLGDCADYLFNTHKHLCDLGINDRMLAKLALKVGKKRVASCRAEIQNMRAARNED